MEVVKIYFNSSVDHFWRFSFILCLVSVSGDPGEQRLEHCRFQLPSRSFLEEFKSVVHFSAPPWLPNGGRVLWYLCDRRSSIVFLAWVVLMKQVVYFKVALPPVFLSRHIFRWLPKKAEKRFTCLLDMAIPRRFYYYCHCYY